MRFLALAYADVVLIAAFRPLSVPIPKFVRSSSGHCANFGIDKDTRRVNGFVWRYVQKFAFGARRNDGANF